MKFLRKLHNRREPPGLEREILRRLPMAWLGSTAVPVLVALGGRWLPHPGPAAEAAKQVKTLEIFAFALGLTLWTALLTVAMGCVLVVFMKGPAYVADGYSPDDPEYTPEDQHRHR